MKHILSALQFKKEDLEKILARAEIMEVQCKSGKIEKLLQDKIVACIFFEPSTRTRLSFETAALKLGAQVISAENAAANSSSYKGESVEDTSRILCSYADAIVVRHPLAGAIDKMAQVATKPVINAGDGANQHPTQGLLDVFTIKKEQGRLSNLHIAFGGDLLNSRTLRSLLPLLRLYKNNTFYFVSPQKLALPREFMNELKRNQVSFEEMQSLEKVLSLVDVLYMTRVQKERFANRADYEKVKGLFILRKEHLKNMKKNAIILHPLPRLNEIETEMDADPRAAYFRQAENGLFVRMALFLDIFGL
ncbi:MAG: aspartate carbamoyltransferase [Patescibacteria group bacterium]